MSTALAYLRSIEWQPDLNVGRGFYCWECGDASHKPSCPLAAAIADAEELEKRRGLRSKAEVEAKRGPQPLAGNATVEVVHWRAALRWVLGEME